MKVDRVKLLQALEQVQPGLSSKEIIEQSSCFVFSDGFLSTFNDEVCCRIPLDVGFTGAVTAAGLLETIRKLPEDEIELFILPEKSGELRIKGKNRKAGIALQAEILLPINKIETPQSWKPIPDDFVEALEVVIPCAMTPATSSDSGGFRQTCVHIHNDWIEACDNYQLARFPLETGVRAPILVRATSLKGVVGLGVVEIAETRVWLHFRTQSGLVYSARKHNDDYRDLSRAMDMADGVAAVLPGGLAEVVAKAEIFSKASTNENKISVELRPNEMILTGTGSHGWYAEKKKIAYDGPSILFLIAPKLLIAITKRHNECLISPTRLKVDGGKFVYVTSLGTVQSK